MSASRIPWEKMNHRDIARRTGGGEPAKSYMILMRDTENNNTY
jgi:hypothetical protein